MVGTEHSFNPPIPSASMHERRPARLISGLAATMRRTLKTRRFILLSFFAGIVPAPGRDKKNKNQPA